MMHVMGLRLLDKLDSGDTNRKPYKPLSSWLTRVWNDGVFSLKLF